MTFRTVLPVLIMTTLVMTGSLVQASQVTVEVEDAGFADRALRQTPTSTNNVACSSGLSAVKFGADVICVQSADGGDNIGNGNQVADGAVSLGGKAISGSDSTSGGQANGGTNSITGRRSLLTWGSSSNPKPSNPVPTNNIACSTGFTAVKSGAGTVCIQSADGGDNIGNGNQIADGAVGLGGSARSGSDSTSGGQANGGTNSITGRRSLLTWGSSSNPKPSNPVPTNNIACSTGFTAVKSGAGTVCIQSADGGDNIGNGNQVADGAVSLGGKAISGSDSTSGGQANGGTNSITGRRSLLTWGSSSNPNPKPSNPAPTNNIACSTGFVAVKSGVGSICVQQADGGVNALNGNQVADGAVATDKGTAVAGGDSTNGGQANGGSNTITG